MMNLKAELMLIMKSTVLSKGGHKMNEKAYKSMNTVGAWSIVFGVINIVVGQGCDHQRCRRYSCSEGHGHKAYGA